MLFLHLLLQLVEQEQEQEEEGSRGAVWQKYMVRRGLARHLCCMSYFFLLLLSDMLMNRLNTAVKALAAGQHVVWIGIHHTLLITYVCKRTTE
jgi:hypothetical protein